MTSPVFNSYLHHLIPKFIPKSTTIPTQFLQTSLRIMLVSVEVPQPCSSLFRCQITLSLSHQLKSHHKLSHSRRPQQRRIINGMKSPVIELILTGLKISGRWCSMPAHGIRHWAVEQVVVLCRQLLDHQSQVLLLL